MSNLHVVRLTGAIRTWSIAGTYESCGAMLYFLENLAPAPISEIWLMLSIQWQVPAGELVPHANLLEDDPERKTSDYALRLLRSVDWLRLDVLRTYTHLKHIYLVVEKEKADTIHITDYFNCIIDGLPAFDVLPDLHLGWQFWDEENDRKPVRVWEREDDEVSGRVLCSTYLTEWQSPLQQLHPI